ncbi:MAG: hypothetical protein JNM36_07075 [Chitinophagales bacterium]|nr:hypothetical protein [Chitinophagales bacterium]
MDSIIQLFGGFALPKDLGVMQYYFLFFAMICSISSVVILPLWKYRQLKRQVEKVLLSFVLHFSCSLLHFS